MRIAPISCIRPRRDHAAEALGQLTATDGQLDALVKDGPFELDVSRSLYLCELAESERSQTMLVCGCKLTELGGAAANPERVAARAERLSVLGAQDEPVVVSYAGNIALDIILGAAKSATPLYALKNGSRRLVVWRVSRPEAVEALIATFATMDGIIVAGQDLAEALVVHSGTDAPLALAALVPADQLAGTTLSLPRGLFIRKLG